MAGIQVMIRLDSALLAWVDEQTKVKRCSRSQFLRDAIWEKHDQEIADEN